MGLREDIEADKKALAALQEEGEVVEEEVIEEEVVEEQEDDPVDEPEVKEEQEEEVEEEVKEEKPDAAAFAKMRRELAAAKKREAELLASKEAPQEEEVEQAPLPAEVQRLVYEAQVRDAEKAFMAYENDFRKAVPDYDDISNAYKVKLFESNKVLNPRKAPEEVWEMTKTQLLIKARDYLNSGFDPIEELYNEALELGIQPIAKVSPTEEKKKPDMARIAANRARNAGTAGAKGRAGSAMMTREVAANLPVSEWKKLPKDERERLMRG